MSLTEDFNNYYRNTFVGFRDETGRVRPFFINRVTSRRGLNNTTQYLDEGLQYLKFEGRTLDGIDGEVWEGEVRFDTGQVVLELPELGYIDLNGVPVWVRYNPVHQRVKGLCGVRLVGASMNDRTAIAIYRAIHAQPDHTARQFAFHNGEVYYKGRIIGRYSDDAVTLVQGAAYLGSFIEKCFPEKTVEVR